MLISSTYFVVALTIDTFFSVYNAFFTIVPTYSHLHTMTNFEKNYPFTKAEWDACLKVLDSLKNDPTNNPDNDLFKSLVQKVVKSARKKDRKATYAAKIEADLVTQRKSVIVSNAQKGVSLYSAGNANELEQDLTQLKRPKSCYCCNKKYNLAHSFYNRLCPSCAATSYAKRFVNKDLSNLTAVVTGCRVKVGYATTLKLLRNGASVIGTSRFPALALEQYQGEPDHAEWQHRLKVYGLDLRILSEIEYFVAFVIREFNKLDILVNNAAQTIKYPEHHFYPLISSERELLKSANARCLPNPTPIGKELEAIDSKMHINNAIKLNRFNQPVDSREKTSWNSTLSEISLVELLEVNLINQIAPFLLIQQFKKDMARTGDDVSHVINVTSTEGLFNHANKTSYHPHTNMTKASLNMITRTSAEEFFKSNILMNSVDVGWISTGACENLRQQQFEKAYIPPLDSVDGASRALDPIYRALEGNKEYGRLFKDFKVHEW